jgi:hypothetical protein
MSYLRAVSEALMQAVRPAFSRLPHFLAGSALFMLGCGASSGGSAARSGEAGAASAGAAGAAVPPQARCSVEAPAPRLEAPVIGLPESIMGMTGFISDSVIFSDHIPTLFSRRQSTWITTGRRTRRRRLITLKWGGR